MNLNGELKKDICRIRKLIIFVFGFTLVIFGMILLFIPGPGIPVIFFGFVVLAAEFLWARHLLRGIKKEVRKSRKWFKKI